MVNRWISGMIVLAALALVTRDLLLEQRTIAGTVAGIWLAARILATALQLLKLGLSEHRFWSFFADAPDGAINSIPRRRLAWCCYNILTYCNLLEHDVRPAARVIKRES